MALSGQTLLVTGAGGALGVAVVRTVLDAGAQVVAVDLTQSALQALAAQMPSHVPLECKAIDAGNEEAMQALVRECPELSGVAHIVGGWSGGHPVSETGVDVWEKMIGINLFPAVVTAKCVAPRLMERRGAMVLVGAAGALGPAPLMAAYAATKAAVHNLVQSLAAELKPSGARVNAVLPGTIRTAANLAAMPEAEHERGVTPEQVAEAIAFLLSPGASGITGSLIQITGRG